jgi:hypothetical protein
MSSPASCCRASATMHSQWPLVPVRRNAGSAKRTSVAYHHVEDSIGEILREWYDHRRKSNFGRALRELLAFSILLIPFLTVYYEIARFRSAGFIPGYSTYPPPPKDPVLMNPDLRVLGGLLVIFLACLVACYFLFRFLAGPAGAWPLISSTRRFRLNVCAIGRKAGRSSTTAANGNPAAMPPRPASFPRSTSWRPCARTCPTWDNS